MSESQPTDQPDAAQDPDEPVGKPDEKSPDQPDAQSDVEADNQSDDGRPDRGVARRVFCAELNNSTYQFSEGDEERATKYVQLPTGGIMHRAFVVGTLVEKSTDGEGRRHIKVNDGHSDLRAYAGQYQPDSADIIDDLTPPMYVAVVGKVRRFIPEDRDQVYLSLEVEDIAEVSEATRINWLIETADQTLNRIERLKKAELSSLEDDVRENPHIVDHISRSGYIYDTDKIRRVANAVPTALETVILNGA